MSGSAPHRLFLDGQYIASMRNVVRTFHPATKHPANPVVRPDQPWERSMGHNAGTVLYQNGVFRYWYQSFTLPRACVDSPGTNHGSYAESRDGIHWTKPSLDTVRLKSGERNNLFATDVAWINVIDDHHETDPSRRYKMLSYRDKWDTANESGWAGAGWVAYYSPDGLRWKAHSHQAIYRATADAGTLFGWDDWHGAYVAYFRPVRNLKGRDTSYHGGPPPVDEGMRRFHKYRLIGRATSPDFLEWSATETVLTPSEGDAPGTEPSYGMPVSTYHGYYIGQTYVLYAHEEEPVPRGQGLMDVQLTASRDGINWTRLGGHQPFIARGTGGFDAGMVGPNASLIEKDGLLWFYYNGWSGEHYETKAYRRGRDPGLWEMGRMGSGTGLATLRQDGFISVDAGEDEGELVTTAGMLGGKELMINAAAHGPAGYVTAEIVDGEGKPVEGYSADDCDRFTGDSVRHRVTWRGQDAKGVPAGEHAVRFRLRSASLYSYTIT